MSRLLLILVTASLTGCATCDRHPVICGVAIASVALSVPSLVNHRTGSSGTDGRDVQVPGVDCSTGSCK